MNTTRWAAIVWRGIYTALLYLISPIAFFLFARPTLGSPAEFRRLRERLGFVPKIAEGKTIWIHAVSVGEVQAAAPLIRRLSHAWPDYRLWVTTSTITGSMHLRRSFPRVRSHSYLPYDLPGAVSRFLHRSKPTLAIMMETELWPNLLRACADRGLPLVIVNGRITERSYNRYRRALPLIQSAFAGVSVVLAQSASDAQRFRALSARTVILAGNLKFDLQFPDGLKAKGRRLRAQLGTDRPIWIAASTHPGEETLILQACRRVIAELPRALMILVPRHPDRFEPVAALCARHGLTTVRRSEQRSCTPETHVFLGDSMGELMQFYAAADVAFVGGSLVPIGGHNILEPAALGLPVLTGPHTQNLKEIIALFEREHAIRVVTDDLTLGNAVVELLANRGAATEQGARGQHLIRENAGVLNTTIEVLEQYLRADASNRST
ncbi:MAG: lipid IV(A) 3-deoxy-D-manno-octulosonic acid transferase [Thiotrichales bacterium]